MSLRKKDRINNLLDKLRDEAEDFSEVAYGRCEELKQAAFIHYPRNAGGYVEYKRLLDAIESLQDTSTALNTALYSLREELGHVEKRQNREN